MIKELTLPEIIKSDKNSIKRGPFGGALKKEIFVEDGYLVYEQKHAINKDFKKGRYYIDDCTYKELESFSVKPKDLIISCSGTIGKIAEIPMHAEKGIINQALLKLSLDEKIVSNKYFIYLFESTIIQDKLFSLSNGSGLKNFPPMAIIKTIRFPIPPLNQQQKIAAILDAADALRQNDKALIAKYDELTQALFLDMFGDPVSNPEGWEKAFLKSVSTKITDGTHFSPEPQTEGFPYITAKHVKSYGLDFYSKPTYVSEEAHNEIYKRCTPEYGDVLYIKDGATTGIACINTFDEPFSMLSSLALIKPKKDIINSYFLCFWLNNPNIKSKLLSEFMSGAAIQRYTLTKINSFELIVPPLTLQNQFAERITLIEEQKAIAQASLVKSEELFSSLLQKAFKGELV